MRGDKGRRLLGDKEGGRGGRRIRTNLSAIGKDRANPRTTRRWTTWRHVVGLSVDSRQKARGGNERETKRREISSRSRFLGTRGAASTASTKRFRSFDIPNPPRIMLVLFHRPSVAFVVALKRRVFARSRSDVAN